MVVDYARLTHAWQTLEPILDHANLNDVLDYPTTEYVAYLILVKLHERVSEVFKVKLWEGPGQFVEVQLES